MIEKIIAVTYVYWVISSSKNGIKYVDYKKRIYFKEFISKEISLIVGVAKKCKKYEDGCLEIPEMIAFKNIDLYKAEHLKKIVTIERIIHKRAAHMSKRFRDVQMETLLSLSRSLLYYAIDGNKYPTNADEYKKRQKNIGKAIDALYKMNRPVRELSYDNIFTEKEMDELCHSMNEAKKILVSIRESDEVRFAHLITE